MGLLFWPQLPPSSPARSKRARVLSDEERALERDLGLESTGQPRTAPNLFASLKQLPQRVPPDCVLDVLPAARPPIYTSARREYFSSNKRQRCGALPAGVDAAQALRDSTDRTIVTEEVVCSMLKPAAAAVLLRSGFVGAYASALDSLSELVSAYLQQLCLAMRRCADSRAQRAMAAWHQRSVNNSSIPVAAHILDLVQDALNFIDSDPACYYGKYAPVASDCGEESRYYVAVPVVLFDQ